MNIQSPFFVLLLVAWSECYKDLEITQRSIVIHKCCPEEELLNENFRCQHVNVTNTEQWTPTFYDEHDQPSFAGLSETLINMSTTRQ